MSQPINQIFTQETSLSVLFDNMCTVNLIQPAKKSCEFIKHFYKLTLYLKSLKSYKIGTIYNK